MRTSTALAVLSALCAIAAAFMPEPAVLLSSLSLFFRRGGWLSATAKASSPHPFSPGEGSQGAGGGCPLGFGSNTASPSSPSSASTAPLLERRTWYVGAGGGWTGAVEEDDQEGPLWLERGGGFAVDGAGDVAEVAATENEAAEAVRRDESAGLLARPPVDLKGAFVLPGFVDPHVHLIPAGLALTSHADLREAASREEFEARVASAARRLLRQEQGGGSGGWDCSSSSDGPENLPWLMGGWWDESRWAGFGTSGMPTAAWIDAALERAANEEEEDGDAPATAACLRALPVLLSRMDAHMAVANRAALRRALLRERERRREEEEKEEWGVAAEGARELLASAAVILSGGSSTTNNSQPTTTNRFVDASTGLVREAGLLVVARAAPPPTLAARRAALAAASARLLSAGVTAVGDMGRSPFVGGDPRASWDDLEELYDPAAAAAVAEAEGMGGAGGGGGGAASAPPLQVRIAAYLPLETWPRLAARVAARGAVTGPLHAAGVKCFWDGSLGSRTALMTEPYDEEGGGEEGGGSGAGTNSNKTKNRGVRMVDSPEEATRLMVSADAADLQPAVHAIGDAAVDEATAALAAVAKARAAARSSGSSSAADAAGRPPPLRLEHVQHISGPDAPRRLAELGDVVAVINPQHLVSDAKLLSALSPAMRGAGPRRTHPWRSLLRAGVPLAIGSDWPIVDLDPWAELWAAVHRRGVGERGSGDDSEADGDSGSSGDGAGAALTAEEALRASTAGAAYAAGLDAWCGRLVPGLKADFVLLDGSPFEEYRRLLARTRPRVRATFVGGVCRHGCGGDEEGEKTTTAKTTT